MSGGQQPGQQPEQEPVQPSEPETPPQWSVEEWGSSPFGWFVGAGIGVLVAVLCFTPIWDEVAGRSTGRRAGFGALLGTIGPFGVAAIALAVAVVFAVVGVRKRRAGDRG
ncbi:hypothetical protein EAO79_04520 [Plantibacter sp. PA-3-X8]|uniref:hypothetical protein n=1 Tax=unclassified Plantibacter TaxID=2624265 RepID=UPI000F5DE11F|nr:MULTISPECIES: hypothetical protein [unclassified Plantibacter]AZH82240.1 hypothetical protein EAO79_04520 [Plantibacter sp. PA-3-X8]MBD8101133.1 hypothetical protein [Plantibacter sp. CFBP 8775]